MEEVRAVLQRWPQAVRDQLDTQEPGGRGRPERATAPQSSACGNAAFRVGFALQGFREQYGGSWNRFASRGSAKQLNHLAAAAGGRIQHDGGASLTLRISEVP